MTIRSFRYWDDLSMQMVAARIAAERENCGIRVAWLEGGPIIKASLDIPAGVIEEVFPK